MLDISSCTQQAHYNPLLRAGLQHARVSRQVSLGQTPARRPFSSLVSFTGQLAAGAGGEKASPRCKTGWSRGGIGKEGWQIWQCVASCRCSPGTAEAVPWALLCGPYTCHGFSLPASLTSLCATSSVASPAQQTGCFHPDTLSFSQENFLVPWLPPHLPELS